MPPKPRTPSPRAIAAAAAAEAQRVSQAGTVRKGGPVAAVPSPVGLAALERITAAVKARQDAVDQAERELRNAVWAAAAMALPWELIGGALGCSRQAAHARYGPHNDAGPPRRIADIMTGRDIF